jgi:FKBP-type peptidyl-prolyl cis-trans isomerase SlyD
MSIAENMVVALEYELRDPQTSEILDSNIGMHPLEFIVGKGNIIPGLENEIAKMNSGDSGRVLVKAIEAYGEYDETAVETYPKEQFAGITIFEGMTLYGQDEYGQTIEVRVKAFDDSSVTVDYNHPLAGRDLLFDVNILCVREATTDERLSGMVAQKESGGCCGGGGNGGGSHGCCGH